MAEPLPGSRQEAGEGAAPSGGDGGDRAKVMQRLEQMGGQGEPLAGSRQEKATQDQPKPSTDQPKPPVPETIELTLPDGRTHQVSRDKALELAAQGLLADQKLQEVNQLRERMKPYEAIDLWVRNDPSNADKLRALIEGKQESAGRTQEEDDVFAGDLFSRQPGGGGTDPEVAKRLGRMEAIVQRLAEEADKSALENALDQRTKDTLSEMRHYPIFTNEAMRPTVEVLLKQAARNPRYHDLPPARLASAIAQELESAATQSEQQRAAHQDRASRLAGRGPLRPPAGQMPTTYKPRPGALNDGTMRLKLLEELRRRRSGE